MEDWILRLKVTANAAEIDDIDSLLKTVREKRMEVRVALNEAIRLRSPAN